MSDATLASSGYIVLADEERVYVADGFGEGNDPTRAVSAFEATNGELLWQRTDLTPDLADDVFLQVLTGRRLVVNAQYHTVTAVNAITGESLWTFSLPNNYGAVRSTARGDVLFVTTEAPREGDVRPPVVYALDLDNGTVIWETALAEGTDLQWHNPPIAQGLVFVSSTLSHPGSATGNKVHALDIETGEVRWVVDLGGEQGFSFYPALVSGDLLVLFSPVGSTLALDISDGTQVWTQPGTFPLAIGLNGAIYATDDGIVQLSHADGEARTLIEPRDLGMPIEGGTVQDNVLIMTGRLGAIGFDLTNEVLTWRVEMQPAAAPLAITDRIIATPTGNPRGVAVFSIP
jgi:outer membrane protein assembly factor BamB